MDDEAAAAAAAVATAAYVTWEEEVISNEKGRRVVHYKLRDAGGGAVLAVVGRERSIRHMSYAVPTRFLRSLLVKPPLAPAASPAASSPATTADGVALKWKTRREVTDWLSSFVTDSVSYGSPMMDRFSDEEDAEPTNNPTSKGISSGKMGHLSKEFSWLGSAWNCRKRRKHYRSFCRNKVTISVYDFVYVMAEDSKRLVAYVEDLYEDLRANNMVVVRWFHKVDEVGIALPPDVSDKEIFFSLCLQDFSVECIDGLAAVLSPQDFEKFWSEARQSRWEPYLCCRQIDNDDIKPFDIAQLQGYWSQELLRSLYTPSMKFQLKIKCGGTTSIGSKKKGDKDVTETCKSKGFAYGRHSLVKKSSTSRLLRKELLKHKLQHQQLALGSEVEVLSQDSGIRGCWFRCTLLKRSYDKVKVRYLDLQNAEETGNVEEWILASRVAAPDKFGIRLFGRPIVRPHQSHRGTGIYNAGSVVDARWCDGWWEGIVILKESEGKLHVYFPGEERVSVFDQADLRHSQDWVGNKWSAIKDRCDIANSLSISATIANRQPECKGTPEARNEMLCKEDVPNLTKLIGLNWSSVKKRKFGKESLSKSDSGSKRQGKCSNSSGSSRDEVEQSNVSGGFVIPKSLTVEQEICKIGGDHLSPKSLIVEQMTVEQEICKIGGDHLSPKSLTVEQEICKIGGDHLFSAPMALCSGLLMSR